MPHLTTLISFAAMGVFGMTILINLLRLQRTIIQVYTLESLLVAFVLISMGYMDGAPGMIAAGILTLVVKAILAPWFLNRIVQRYKTHFSAKPYLNLSMTLLVLSFIIIAFRYVITASSSHIADPNLASLLFASVFLIFFFIVNHRGALSQIIGILAIENSIVLLAAFLGIVHSVALELAIAFDIGVWTIIAVAFLNMLYHHFGSVEHVILTHLKEQE
jgi:hydrogenase-4 component E